MADKTLVIRDMQDSVLVAKIFDRINHLPPGVVIESKNTTRDATLLRDSLYMHIYIDDHLVGYELYSQEAQKERFISDTDLYEFKLNNDLKFSMLNEIQYTLNEYIEGRIEIYLKEYMTWLGRKKRHMTISINLPSGQRQTHDLPCINQIDFGL